MAKENIVDLYREEPKHPRKKICMSLPMPPSVNHMYVNTRHGGKRLTRQAEDYIRRSRSLIHVAVEEQCWKQQGSKAWLYADLAFYMPDRRIRDSHNTLKLLFDVMQGILFQNDYYVMPNIMAVEYDKTNPRVDVILRPQTKKDRKDALNYFEKYFDIAS